MMKPDEAFLADALQVNRAVTVDLNFEKVRFTPSGETNEDGVSVPAYDVEVNGQAVGTLLFDHEKDAWYRLEPKTNKDGDELDIERKGSAPKLKTAAKKLVKARFKDAWDAASTRVS